MYVFILAMYLGLHPDFNKPSFTYLEQFPSPKACEDRREQVVSKIENEEAKKRIGCIILYIPPKEKEV